MLSNNVDLPTLNFFAARSTWAMVFAAAITVANAVGLDLMAFFGQIGAGGTPEEVLATGDRLVSAWQAVAPLALGLWAWIERRAPNFRLTLRGDDETDWPIRLFALVAALAAGLLASGGGAAFADEVPRCQPSDQLVALLGGAFGETMAGAGILAGESGAAIALLVNSETGSWTVLTFEEGQSCVLLFGQDWTGAPQAPPGDPA